MFYLGTQWVIRSIVPVYGGIFLLFVLLLTGPAIADDQAVLFEQSPALKLLGKMTKANRELTYKGRFTYEYGGAISTMEVMHTLQNGQVIEKLSHLSGAKRELLRHSDMDSCSKPAEHLLSGIALGVSGDEKSFTDFYNVILKEQGRIADREVNVVHLVPKDKYRYGYVLALDSETGLLLQTMVIGTKKQVLERFQFVSIQIGMLLDEAELAPTELSHYRLAEDKSPCSNSDSQNTSRWNAQWLPGGFVLADQQLSEDQQVETLVYTDGLAVFSVFIDAGESGFRELQGQRGSTIAFLVNKQVNEKMYTICVVGEVPAGTARRVAEGIQFQALTQ